MTKLKLLAAAATLALCGAVSPSYGATVGFIYSSGSPETILEVPGADFTEAFGINNAGQVVGDYQINSGSPHVGFLYSGGVYTTINVPGSSLTIPWSINNAGQIAGYYDSAGNGYGFIYSGGNFTTLSVIPPPSITWGYGVNDAGQVVGAYGTTSGHQGFLYSGNYTTLSVPGADFTVALGINNAGQVTGYFNVNNNSNPQGFLYSGGAYDILNAPGATYTYPSGINNIGNIVGDTNLGPFLYSGGHYKIFAGNGTNTEAFGVNDADQIVGRIDNATPLPASLPLFATGLGALGLFGWQRKRTNVAAIRQISRDPATG